MYFCFLGGQHWYTNKHGNGLCAASFLPRKGRCKKALRYYPAQKGAFLQLFGKPIILCFCIDTAIKYYAINIIKKMLQDIKIGPY
jgi:hypothetical protein